MSAESRDSGLAFTTALEAIDAEEVTWRRRSFYWWSEHFGESVLVTKVVSALVGDGLARRETPGGYPLGGTSFGPVALTRAGRTRLRAIRESGTSRDD